MLWVKTVAHNKHNGIVRKFGTKVGQKYIRRYKLKILKIYLAVIWSLLTLTGVGDVLGENSYDDKINTLTMIIFLSLPTLFYILNS